MWKFARGSRSIASDIITLKLIKSNFADADIAADREMISSIEGWYKGNVYYIFADYKNAIDAFDRAIKSEPLYTHLYL